jgi:lipoprotein-anchoring transpeptidase ErfK/SrfK
MRPAQAQERALRDYNTIEAPAHRCPSATLMPSFEAKAYADGQIGPQAGASQMGFIKFTRNGFLLVALSASPALASNTPLDSGPLADFLNIFRQSAIPRRTVIWTHGQKPGTIVISTSQRRLYYVLGSGQALEYGVGVGRQGFSWSGTKTVSMKREWPDWTPPSQMLKRRPDLPRHMAGGIDNPLGARALYLGSSLYRIHGSNEPDTIGAAVSSGCIRMTNNDVADLYNRVKVGTKVVVLP